jgi:hypothetical protein
VFALSKPPVPPSLREYHTLWRIQLLPALVPLQTKERSGEFSCFPSTFPLGKGDSILDSFSPLELD